MLRGSWGRRSVGVLALAVCTVGACSSGGHRAASDAPGSVAPIRRNGPHIAITALGACPSSLGPAVDVTDTFPDHARTLLPVGQRPRTGLVCAYGAGGTTGSTKLVAATRLDAAHARLLAAAVARVSLAPAKGAFSCPAGMFGADTVLAFQYATERPVDLWYATSGCRTLDNGTVLAFEGANPSFYDRFESTFASVTKSR